MRKRQQVKESATIFVDEAEVFNFTFSSIHSRAEPSSNCLSWQSKGELMVEHYLLLV
jgi:hypothetical protein